MLWEGKTQADETQEKLVSCVLCLQRCTGVTKVGMHVSRHRDHSLLLLTPSSMALLPRLMPTTSCPAGLPPPSRNTVPGPSDARSTLSSLSSSPSSPLLFVIHILPPAQQRYQQKTPPCSLSPREFLICFMILGGDGDSHLPEGHMQVVEMGMPWERGVLTFIHFPHLCHAGLVKRRRLA